MSGNIGVTPVAEVLRELETASLDARLWIETEFGMGEVLFHKGKIIQARLGGARGRTALLRLLSVHEGKFGTESCGVSDGEPLVESVDALNELHKSRQVEWEELCSHAPPLSSVLRLTGAGSEIRDSSRGIQRVIFALIDGHRTLNQVLEESSFDPVEALKVVVKAIDDGLVLYAPQPSTLFPLASMGDASGVLPRFATPALLPRLDPTSVAPYGVGLASWRHSTLVGLGIQNTAQNAPHHSLAPSPIIDLGQASLVGMQSDPTASPKFPSHTKTVIDGFGLGRLLRQEYAKTEEKSQSIHETSSEGNSPSGASGSTPDVSVERSENSSEQDSPSDDAAQVEELPAEDTGLPSEEFPAAASITKVGATQRFVDRYEVLLRIGRGGMGTVYLCRLSSAGVGFHRLFALKLLRSHLSRDTQAAKDFLQEARLAGHLHHSNVVAVSDAGFHGKQPYLVMDYVEGCSLKQLLKGCPNRSPYLILPIIIDALTGLHAAHNLQDESGTDLKLVHCDVSPENLLVGVDGTCRLTDFGVARKANRVLGATIRGKPGYVSPEQIREQTFDHRADVFSMGVVLWNALTGQKLFAGSTVEETLSQVCNKPIPAPSTAGADSLPGLDEVILRALSRKPDERFDSAEEMHTALSRVAMAHGGLATPKEIASWVREAAGSELTQRRLAVLDASRRPTVPPDATESTANDGPPPSLLTSGSMASDRPEFESRTIAFAPNSGRTSRVLLILAGILALAAVVATLVYPREVARLFSLNMDTVAPQAAISVDLSSLEIATAAPVPSVQTSPAGNTKTIGSQPAPKRNIANNTSASGVPGEK